MLGDRFIRRAFVMKCLLDCLIWQMMDFFQKNLGLGLCLFVCYLFVSLCVIIFFYCKIFTVLCVICLFLWNIEASYNICLSTMQFICYIIIWNCINGHGFHKQSSCHGVCIFHDSPYLISNMKYIYQPTIMCQIQKHTCTFIITSI